MTDPLADLDSEIRDHLEREAQEHVNRGMTPEAARSAALRKFGNVMHVKESARAVWIPAAVDQMVQDLRYAVRMVRRSPGFSAVVILTLAIAIGMNTAVFSVVNAVLLRPLSFPYPERLVWLTASEAGDGFELVGAQDVIGWREATSLDRLVAYDEYDSRVLANGLVLPARLASVSDDFWDLAGATAALGRRPLPGQPEVMLSYAFFEHALGANPAIIGASVQVGNRRGTVVGVLPPAFHVDLVPPASFASLAPHEIDAYYGIVVRPPQNGMLQLFRVVGRLKPGVSIEAARAELLTIRTRTAARNPAIPFKPTQRVLPLREKLVGAARPRLLILLAAVAAVLLVGCANIASLLLARATARQKELAIRTAVGAGRARMLRQLLIESLVLAVAGGATGVLVAKACLEVMGRLIPQAVPRLLEASLDGRVLAFALAVSVVTALVFGIAPVFSVWKISAFDVLKDGTRTVSATAASVRVRSWLVTGEVALTLVLLCGAGLLVKSLARITAYPAGFVPQQTLTVTVAYNTNGMQNTEVRRREYAAEVLQRIQGISGVRAVGMTTNAGGRLRMFVEGVTVPMEERPTVFHSSASEGYAQAIGMRVASGRWLTDREPEAAFVVNQALARQVFPGEDPIGKRIQVDGPPGATAAAGAKFGTVVGVVANLKYAKLDTAAEPEIFADYRHANPFDMTFVARVDGDPRATAPDLRALVAGIDRSQPVSDVKTVESVLIDSIAPRRFTVFLLGTFAGAALLLALVGIYGVIAYSVSLRTREIGVRMALGAARGDVMRIVLRQGMVIATVGLVVGTAAAVAATRVMTGLLYDVTPGDPATFATVAALVAATALAACCGPALKAARVDPLDALRCE